MSISFIIPKINQPYRVQKHYLLHMNRVDSVGSKRLNKNGITVDRWGSVDFVLGAGGIFKILTWFPVVPYMKIRIIENPNKPYEKFSAYVIDMNSFLSQIEVEEISV